MPSESEPAILLSRIADLEDRLDEAVSYIRDRHNYGPRRREEIRLSILQRHSRMEGVTDAE